MMQTDSTSLEPHNLIASDRVEGTPVRSTDGAAIGTIERVMIDKLTGNVAYAVLSFNRSVGVGQRRYLSLGVSSPTIENSRLITSTSPKRSSA
jgi:PRC-barrel domain